MPAIEELKQHARDRELECRHSAEAFGSWLSFLGRLNWITVVLPAVLSALAGTVIFAGLVPAWKTWAGLAAFLSSILVIIHKTKNCDAHQAECKRLQKAYDGLAARYRTFYSTANNSDEFMNLEAKLASIKETANSTVPEKYKLKAQKQLAGRDANNHFYSS